jgi:hypothetical protein
VTKAFDVSLMPSFPFLSIKDKASYKDSRHNTNKYDAEAMRYLSWALYPCVLGEGEGAGARGLQAPPPMPGAGAGVSRGFARGCAPAAPFTPPPPPPLPPSPRARLRRLHPHV